MEQYELSVWKLEPSLSTEYPWKETKIAIIGSNTMLEPCRAIDPKLTLKINGEKTLTFSMYYKYMPSTKTILQDNPWISYLVNEAIIKCYWQDEWYEFIIKDIKESTDKKTVTYTCKERFIQELSKTGYNITLDPQLQNGSGTAPELVDQVLQDTSWVLDQENSDLVLGFVREPFYYTTWLQARDDIWQDYPTSESTTLKKDQQIGLFYSQLNEIAEQCGYYTNSDVDMTGVIEILQFVRTDVSQAYYDPSLNEWIDCAIYRCQDDLAWQWEYNARDTCVTLSCKNPDTFITNAYMKFYLNQLAQPDGWTKRIVISPKTYYEPALKRYVKQYIEKDTNKRVSGYQTTDYYSGATLYNFITNPNTFTSLRGWAGGIGPTQTLSKNDITSANEDIATINILNCVGYVGNNPVAHTAGSKPIFYYNPSVQDAHHVSNSGLTDHLNMLAEGWQPGLNFYLRAYCGYSRKCTDASQTVDYYYKYWHDVNLKENVTDANEKTKLSVPFTPRLTTYLLVTTKANSSQTYCYPYNKTIDINLLSQYSTSSANRAQYLGIYTNSKLYYYDTTLNIRGTTATDVSIRKLISNIHPDYTMVYVDTGLIEDDYGAAYTYNTEVNQWANSTTYSPDVDAKYQQLIQPRHISNTSASEDDDNDLYEWKIKWNKPFTSVQAQTEQLGLIIYCPQHRNGNNNISIPLSIRQIDLYPYYSLDNDDTIILTPETIGEQTLVQPVYKYYYTDNAIGLNDAKELSYCDISKTDLSYHPIIQYGNEHKYILQYNQDCQKIANIAIKQSNHFNILQKIAETFQCWVQIYVPHNIDGSLIYDNMRQCYKKYIRLKKDIGQYTGLAFSYGLDLKAIQRTTNSDAIVTKTIVIPYTNNALEQGICTIARSNLNFARENYLLDFSYYIQQGLLTQKQVDQDFYGPATDITSYDTDYQFPLSNLSYLSRLHQLNITYDEYTKELTQLQLTRVHVQAACKTARETYEHTNNQIVQNLAWLQKSLQVFVTDNILPLALQGSTTQKSRAQTTMQLQADAHQARISMLQLTKQLQTLDMQITTTVQQQQRILAITNNLNHAFNNKYAEFIREGTWSGKDYISDNDYYMAAQNVAYTSARPKASYSISVYRLASHFEYSMRKFKLGDLCYVEDPELFGYVRENDQQVPYREKVVLTECQYNFDEPSKDTFKVQNYHTQFEDLFHRIAASVQSLQYKEGEYARIQQYVTPQGYTNATPVRQL